MADLPKLARVGDRIECDVRHPFPQTIRMTLDTPAATAHANELLTDPKSGWRLSGNAGVPAAPHQPFPHDTPMGKPEKQ